MGPPDRGGDWVDEGVEGVHRFLSRLWRLGNEASSEQRAASSFDPSWQRSAEGDAQALVRKVHWAVDKATRDFQRGFQFNTVISAVMELVNDAYRLKPALTGEDGERALALATATAASLIFPFAPHVASEVWAEVVGGDLWEVPWPEADPELLVTDTVTVIVQVNGKLRDRVEAAAGATEEQLLELARGSEKVRAHLDGKEVVKEVVVPGKLVNFVVRG
jgi:leucyl-tRNA synthetase